MTVEATGSNRTIKSPFEVDLPTSTKGDKFPAVDTADHEVRYLLQFVYQHWTSKREVPSLETVARKTFFGVADVKRIFESKDFGEAARRMGIPFDVAPDGLTGKQMLALQVLTNPTDKRDLKTKLKGIGATYAEYRAWLQQPVFSGYINQTSEGLLTDHLPDILTKLTERAMAGDLKAIQYVNELNGRHDPNKQKVAELESVVQSLLEIILRNVTDQDVLARISSEFALVMGQTKPGPTVKGEIGNA